MNTVVYGHVLENLDDAYIIICKLDEGVFQARRFDKKDSPLTGMSIKEEDTLKIQIVTKPGEQSSLFSIDKEYKFTKDEISYIYERFVD